MLALNDRRPTGIGFELGHAIKSRPSGTCDKTILVLVGYGGDKHGIEELSATSNSA
jgi:hypothetical protein